MNASLDFERMPVPTLFKKLFFPTLLGMLSVSAVTTVDGIFVGHGVGSDGIAAINLCIPLLMALTGMGLMVGVGCSVISSLYLSRGKGNMARVSVAQALLSVTLGTLLLLVVILLWPEQTARMLGASAHLQPLVRDYLIGFAPSLLCELWIAISLFVLRLDGVPKLAMWCSIVSAAVNVVLDWLFIFPLGWGVMGAALATSISCLFGAGMALIYLLFYARTLRLQPLRLGGRETLFFFRNIGVQCRIGASALLGEVAMATLMFVGNLTFMHYWGDAGVGAFGVSCYYLPFVFMVGNAIAQSAQPIISFGLGSACPERILAALRLALATALLCGAAAVSAFLLCPRTLVCLFLSMDDRAAQLAVEGFPLYGSGFIFFVLNLTIIGYYQSVEKTVQASFFSLLRAFVFLIPCFLILPSLMGTKGVWLALPISEALTFLTIACLCALTRKKTALPA